jgi:hypothetical protein
MSFGIEQMWPGGSTVEVGGTFTKTASDGTGIIDIETLQDDDEFIFMYGQFSSQTHAGGGDTMAFIIVDGSHNTLGYFATTVDANQTVNLPPAEADAAIAVGNNTGFHTIYQRLFGVAENGHIRITFADMKFATSETFKFYGKFRSKTGQALTVVPNGGTWA